MPISHVYGSLRETIGQMTPIIKRSLWLTCWCAVAPSLWVSPLKSTLYCGVHETCEGQGPHGGVLQSITDTMEMFYDVAAAATAAPTPSASNTAAWSVAPRFKVWWCSDNGVIFSLDIGVCIPYVNYYYLYIYLLYYSNYYFTLCYISRLTNVNDKAHVTQLLYLHEWMYIFLTLKRNSRQKAT